MVVKEILYTKPQLEKKIIYVNPYSILNRYLIVELNSYIYAVNYKDVSLFRPLTSVPDKIETYNFADFPERLQRSLDFLHSPSEQTFNELNSYPIDFYLFEKNSSMDQQAINYLKKRGIKVFSDTSKYIIYQNNN